MKVRRLLLLLCLLVTAGSASAKVIKIGTFPNGGTWQLTEFDDGERLLYIDAEVIPDYEQKEYSGYWFASALTTAPWRKYTCSGIDDFTLKLSSKVKTIGKYAFSQTQVESVEFDPRTEPITIKEGAFYNAQLEAFDFSYVKSIGKGAFVACYQLTSNKFPILEKCEADAFLDCMGLAKKGKIILGKQVSFSNLQGFADLGRFCWDGIKEAVWKKAWIDESHYVPYYNWEYVVPKGSKMTYVWPVEGYGTKDNTLGGYPIENVTGDSDWTLNTTTGEFHLVRTILDAPKYDTPEARPWHALREQIKTVKLSRSPEKNYFYGCTNLENVTTLSDMTHIAHAGGNRYQYPVGERAFYGCSKLSAVLSLDGYPKHPGEIGKEAFYGCSALNDIDLKSCTRIGDKGFSGCSSLRRLDFTSDLKAIDYGAFMNCTGLRSITMTGAAPGVGSSVFSGVQANQVTLYVPASFADTYEKAPWTSFKLDKSIQFDENGLIKGTVSNGVKWELTSNGILRLQGWGAIPDYSSISLQPWYNYRDFIRDIIIDDNIQSIGKNAFALPEGEESKVVTISIPRSCKSIGEAAFRNLNSLRNVYITRVETLGSYAFEGCTNLRTIELGASLQSVGDYVFRNCHGLYDIENMNSTVATTTKNSFADIKSDVYNLRAGGPRKANSYSGQSTVTLIVNNGDIVKYITDANWGRFHIPYADDRGTWVKAGKFGDGMWILYNDGTMVISADNSDITDSDESVGFWTKWDNPNDPCKLTKRIEFTGNMQVVPACFSLFENLESVELCPAIKTIYRYAFENCSKLKSVNFENVDTICVYAFQSAAFETLNLTNVKEIQQGAFRKCQNLTDVQLGPVCKLGVSVFNGCSKLTTIDISSANIEGADGCFSGCSSLKSVTANATILPGGIFRSCKTLETVKLGSKLESITYDAFENCTGLRNIYIDRPTPPALPKGERIVPIGEVDYTWEDAWAFDDLTLSNINLTVPEEYVSAYRAANIWKDMIINGESGNIDAELPTGGSLGKNGTWYLDEYGTLTIDANGDIQPFDSYGKPWCETFNAYVGLIKEVIISDGVTSIPDNFFGGTYFAEASAGVETVKLGYFLQSVGKNSLSFSGIKDVYAYTKELLTLQSTTFNQDAAASNGATLHVMNASDNRYRTYYSSNAATNRFNIVADLDAHETSTSKSGTLGEKGYWTFADGVLTVVYNGAMPTITKTVTDPEQAFRYKWIDFLGQIEEVVVTGTDVEIQPYFLYYEGDGDKGQHPDDHIKTVTLGAGVKSLGRGSLSLYEMKRLNCYGVNAPTLPATINSSYKAFWTSRLTANLAFLWTVPNASTDYARINTEWTNFNHSAHKLNPESNPKQENMIDFETGNMSQNAFMNSDEYPWEVTKDDAASGSFSMKSGNAGIPNSSSSISIMYFYDADGYIFFDAKFMGEGTGEGWDKCRFYIDGEQQFSYGARGKGWYMNNSFPVSAGMHTFKWEYTKDSSMDPDGDAFFVDNISFLQNGKDDDRITGIDTIDNGQLTMDNDGNWFSLDGRKLGGKPAKAGLYIHNGRKVVIK
ncbi:MAG: leucine-rich repeat protein [Bacteroidaceae bacterium]|nr:leucine-rich repeat protein [Bacteroidaceae bacterium]